MIDQFLPPGHERLNARHIYVPRYPHEPLRRGASDVYWVDIRWLLVVDDMRHLQQLEYIMAWVNTIGNMLWISKISLQAITKLYKDAISQTTGEKRSTILKEEYLPTDVNWVFWKAQVAWLENAHNSLTRQISVLQSYNANRRVEMAYPTS